MRCRRRVTLATILPRRLDHDMLMLSHANNDIIESMLAMTLTSVWRVSVARRRNTRQDPSQRAYAEGMTE
jgi:hypothetical protein